MYFIFYTIFYLLSYKLLLIKLFSYSILNSQVSYDTLFKSFEYIFIMLATKNGLFRGRIGSNNVNNTQQWSRAISWW